MIKHIGINNFKSLSALSLPLQNLNVITGINGMGKSTFIQTLLLLRQAYVPNGIGRGIPLKGTLTGNLGSFSDVLYRYAPVDEIRLELKTAESPYTWHFRKGDISDMLQGELPPAVFKDTALFSDEKFQYISAGRITPASTFTKSGEALTYKQFGASGEFAVQYLFEKGTDEMALLSDLTDPHTGKPLPLINQVDFWLKQITPNVQLDIQAKSSLEYELRYKFVTEKGIASYAAVNTAFGLTFALPIITAILAAKPGDLLILENPESDLHPRAQSIIGQLLARAAEAGVQLIIETHSDHIINGICVAIHQGLLKSEKTKLYYFFKDSTDSPSQAIEVAVKSNGRIDDRPLRKAGIEGFFDQAEKDLEFLMLPSQD